MKIRVPNLISKLEKIRRDIDNTIIYLRNIDDNNKPRCPKCGWANLSVRKDKTFLCKSCGYDSKKGG